MTLDYELNLLRKLVEINTDSVLKEGYDECASILIEEAQKNSLDVSVIDGEKGAQDGIYRPNIIITLNSGSDVTLLLESHFDVVPSGPNWTYPPYKLTLRNGKAFGRGTADNKAGIAAAIGAMRLLNKENLDINLKLIASVDEEIGGRYGVDYILSDYGLRGDAALVLDAGPENLYLGASGLIWGKITVKGKQGHAGYPYKSKNAIVETINLLSALDVYKKRVEKKESFLHAPLEAPKQNIWGRFNVTTIKAGEKENIIPGICEVRFDRRLLPEESIEEAEDELRDFFEEAVKKIGCRASLEIIHKLPGYYTQSDHVFVQTVSENIKKIVGRNLSLAGELGGNDGSFFAKNGIPVLCYGTIRADTRFHGVDEFVYLEDIINVRNLIINLSKVKREQIAE
ncbi:MAG: ArgE/DapE family deacylase [Candidatus Bathyarchaeota archaeon]|nr:MAG: ArgE/DapE family deacylase [Candidatus Bathyarchaeota archaeon]